MIIETARKKIYYRARYDKQHNRLSYYGRRVTKAYSNGFLEAQNRFLFRDRATNLKSSQNLQNDHRNSLSRYLISRLLQVAANKPARSPRTISRGKPVCDYDCHDRLTFMAALRCCDGLDWHCADWHCAGLKQSVEVRGSTVAHKFCLRCSLNETSGCIGSSPCSASPCSASASIVRVCAINTELYSSLPVVCP